MLVNYLKVTLAVMRRRKFFTFISLFGISFTMIVLILLTAAYEHLFAEGYPEKHRERTLYASRIVLEDTVNQGISTSPMSIYFIENYLKTLKTPEKIGFSTVPNTLNTYGNGQKVKLIFKYTDPVFWEITSFEFLEGKPYTQQQLDNHDWVAVINDITRDNYFGKNTEAVGKTIEFDGKNLRVIGVVKGCPVTRMVVSADIYLPYTLGKSDPKEVTLQGMYIPLVLAKSSKDLPLIQAEFAAIIPKIPIPQENGFKAQKLETGLDKYFESILAGTLFSRDGSPSRSNFYLFVTLFALLFMSLPAINLVNINISRIMERSSEIGIRKAFGASSKTLVYQFIIENIVLTIIGGAIALLIAGGIIFWFNRSGIINHADVSINWAVVTITLALSVIFGLMSGVLPAWRMSNLPIVDALKG